MYFEKGLSFLMYLFSPPLSPDIVLVPSNPLKKIFLASIPFSAKTSRILSRISGALLVAKETWHKYRCLSSFDIGKHILRKC